MDQPHLFPELPPPLTGPRVPAPPPARERRFVPPAITLQRADALQFVRSSFAAGDQTFIHGMAMKASAREPRLTARQIEQIDRMATKYRDQIDPALVPK